ncbi:MAG: Spy/CpxP family protein refolding chaperone [Alphaproteobacteria bacterium]|nr:Spy/CpxP family protein refolding chaperone [Alphaproteobacteria bacterium]
MKNVKYLVAIAAIALALQSGAGLAQTQPDPHHPDQTTADPAAPSGQQPAGMEMMKMMSGMMKMMSGGHMGMGGMDMAGMGMTERVEGRIAFLRAELKITDAQAKLWDVFADTLRDNAARLKRNAGDMKMGIEGPSLLNGLAAQEKTLLARLDGVRAMRAALEPLYQTLNDDQRKTADELLAPHLGMMGQGMMQGGMSGDSGKQGGMQMQDNAQ